MGLKVGARPERRCRRNRQAATTPYYDRGMPVSVNLLAVHPLKLAAVRREVAPGAVGAAWKPALDKVWEFIRSQPGLRTDGHNIFLYHHPSQPDAPIVCDFGVEVTRTFETAGEVYATETLGGRGCRRRPPRSVQSLERGARRDQNVDGGESERVRWAHLLARLQDRRPRRRSQGHHAGIAEHPDAQFFQRSHALHIVRARRPRHGPGARRLARPQVPDPSPIMIQTSYRAI